MAGSSLPQLNVNAYAAMTVANLRPDISYAFDLPGVRTESFVGEQYVHYRRDGIEEKLIDENHASAGKINVIAKIGRVKQFNTGTIELNKTQLGKTGVQLEQDIYNEIKRTYDVSKERLFFSTFFNKVPYGELNNIQYESDITAASVAGGLIKSTGTLGNSRSEDCSIISASYVDSTSANTAAIGLTFEKLALAANILRARGASQCYVAVPSVVQGQLLSIAANTGAANNFSQAMAHNPDVINAKLENMVAGCIPLRTEFIPGTRAFGTGVTLGTVAGITQVPGSDVLSMANKYDLTLNGTVDANRDFGQFAANTTVNGVTWTAGQTKLVIPVFSPEAIINLYNTNYPLEMDLTKEQKNNLNPSYYARWGIGNMRVSLDHVVFIECAVK